MEGPHMPPCCTHSLTRVVLELLGLAVLVRANEIPNEGFDAFVAPVVEEAVDQNGPTNGFHVPFRKAAFETPVGEDLPPSTPAGMKGMRGGGNGVGGVMGEPRNTEDPAGGRGEERGHKWGHPPAKSAPGWHRKGSKWHPTRISAHGWHQKGSKWTSTQLSTRGWHQMAQNGLFPPNLLKVDIKMVFYPNIYSWLTPKWLKMVL